MADAPDKPDTDAPDDFIGHRARLRERLLADADGLLDHELVEYLLATAIPRRDTKPLAKDLLRTFGGIGPMQVRGMGEVSTAAIKSAHAVALRMLRREAEARPVLDNWQALLDYLRADMGHLTTERFRILHLNTRNMLIRDDVMSEGTIDQSAVHVREVIRRAIDLGSASIILVHNHPSGETSASRADIDVTRAIIEAAKRLGIAVHDHLIIGANGYRSLKSEGLI